MNSTMAMWDMVPTVDMSDYLRPIGTHAPQRFCSELCRKRAERARWKAKWKKRGVNKYIGGGAK